LAKKDITKHIERMSTPSETSEDQQTYEKVNIRPKAFKDYPGQTKAKKILEVAIGASKKRKEPLDHVILHGPPGLGKTTMAEIIANEMGVKFHCVSGPALDKAGHLAGILTALEPGALLFIDEIHRLSITVEELLYSAMEDFYLDIIIGEGPTARSVRMPVAPFTLVGATTRAALLSNPLRDRFGIEIHMEYYCDDSLSDIIVRSAGLLGLKMTKDVSKTLATRSRGTPRIANRLLRRVRDMAEYKDVTDVDKGLVDDTLKVLEIDKHGLDKMDREILHVIHDRYSGGPVGIDTLAATLAEERSTLEDVYEPYLVHRGYLIRGPRGRSISKAGLEHLNLQ
jgi:Holliday junction DNA helicase RuvB